MQAFSLNERGIVPILVVLLMLVLVVVGVTVYSVNKSHNKMPQPVGTSPQPSPASSTTPGTAVSPTAGWKTSTSAVAQFSIMYPSDWTYKASTNNGGAEDIYISSPNGLQISIVSFTTQSAYGQETMRSNPSGLCSACIATNSSETFTVSGYGPLLLDAVTYGAGGGTTNQLILRTPKNSIFIGSPKVVGVSSDVQAFFQGQSQDQNTNQTYAQFASKGDVQTAKQILKTLSY